MASRTLNIILAGRSRGAERALGRTTKALGVTAAAGAAMGVALAGKAVTGAAQLEKQLKEVQTLLPELGDEGFGKLREQVVGFSDDTGVATREAIPALYSAISAGVPPNNVFSFLETANKAAVGGVTELETAVDGISSVVNAYGSDIVNAAQASDVLFTSVRLGKTTFGELSASVNQVAPLAASMGISFEDVAAAFTTVTTKGVPTAQAMTQIRALMQSLAAPTVRQKQVLDQLGISIDANRLANEGFLPSLLEITSATEGNEALQRRLFGSVEALQGALSIVAGEGKQYSSVLDQMQRSAGATDKAFETMADTAEFKWNKAVNRVQNTLTRLGTELLPELTKGLDYFNQILTDNGPALNRFVSDVAGGLTSLIGDVVELARTLGILDDGLDLTDGQMDQLLDTLRAPGWTGFTAVLADIGDAGNWLGNQILGDTLAPRIQSTDNYWQDWLATIAKTPSGMDAIEQALAGNTTQLELLAGAVDLADAKQAAQIETTAQQSEAVRQLSDDHYRLQAQWAATDTSAYVASIGAAQVASEDAETAIDNAGAAAEDSEAKLDAGVRGYAKLAASALNAAAATAAFLLNEDLLLGQGPSAGSIAAFDRVKEMMSGAQFTTAQAVIDAIQGDGSLGTITGQRNRRTGQDKKTKDEVAFTDRERAEAEGRFNQLADSLGWKGDERQERFLAYMDAVRADEELEHRDELAYLARGNTAAESLLADWREGDRKAEERARKADERRKRAEEQRRKSWETLRDIRDNTRGFLQSVQRAGTDARSSFFNSLTNDMKLALHESGQLTGLLDQVEADAEAQASKDFHNRFTAAERLLVSQALGKRGSELTVDDFERAYRDGIINVPGLARGGVVTRPTLAMIGERGPEAVLPLNGRNAGTVVNNYYEFTIDGDVYNIDDLREQMIEWVNIAEREGAIVRT